jgi:hypothetical protein
LVVDELALVACSVGDLEYSLAVCLAIEEFALIVVSSGPSHLPPSLSNPLDETSLVDPSLLVLNSPLSSVIPEYLWRCELGCCLDLLLWRFAMIIKRNSLPLIGSLVVFIALDIDSLTILANLLITHLPIQII